MATYRQFAAEEILNKLRALTDIMNMSSIEVDRNGQIHVKNPEPKVEHINVSRKSNKKRMKQVNASVTTSNVSNTPNFDSLIEQYFDRHPDALNKYIKNYISKNIKVDYVSKDNGRYKIGLFDNDKLISESVLGLTLY